MPQVIVQVGAPMGSGLDSPSAGRDWSTTFLRLGDELLELTADEYLAWTLVAADIDGHQRHLVDRALLTGALRDGEDTVADPEGVVGALVDRGLLLELDTAGPLRDAFTRHVLVPVADGVGADPDEPELFWIEKAGIQLVGMTQELYVLWGFAGVRGSLWDVCAYYAPEPGDGAEALARQVAEMLPVLVATGASILDVLPRR